eukprot:CAMPEP_0170536678 /NCGR_PEP_ID=MMETSP0209-20121228/102280_1 /TAXON_ID=665100 ORGANISM="Litonotus pictus, Strain P1" /NCGR_SAMPLE_ID=MMETSP0209 /ASSEMBLY_ACC=CAM_ASM_000301 /LENGTH=118 /DNA_ID=CAMNT_0010838065 /DNA_START=107 /DNA_END=463 /DNA_ORIENTATION=+
MTEQEESGIIVYERDFDQETEQGSSSIKKIEYKDPKIENFDLKEIAHLTFDYKKLFTPLGYLQYLLVKEDNRSKIMITNKRDSQALFIGLNNQLKEVERKVALEEHQIPVPVRNSYRH